MVPTPRESAPLPRFRINFAWLLKLRWAAVGGQLVTVSVVAAAELIPLRLDLLLGIIAATALTNLILTRWFRRHLVSGRPLAEDHGERWLAVTMAFDVALLTLLLSVTGGPSNPFCVFYLVNLALGAVMLRPRWAFALSATVILSCGVLCWTSLPVSRLETDDNLRRFGLAVALAVSAVIIVYFISRLTRELARLEEQLGAARRRQSQAQRLEALATLAGGAAHELASPLSTIAVVARELELGLERASDDTEAVEDARLIRREVERCRDILVSMAEDAGEHAGETMVPVEVGDLLTEAMVGLAAMPTVRTDISQDVALLCQSLPRRAVARTLRALIKNAQDASADDSAVTVKVSCDGVEVVFAIHDEGGGMEEDVLRRATDPFFTTKEPGAGMGLGLFLARAVADRLGGKLTLDSKPGTGTCVRLALPQTSSAPMP